MWSDSKKKWLRCVSDFEAYWLASKWLRWKIDYQKTRAVIRYKIEMTESILVFMSIKDILSKGSNSNSSAIYSSPIYSSSSRSSKNKSRSSLMTGVVLYSWPCLSKIISYSFLLCSTVIGLDLESHFHSREKMQSFETRLRIIFLALAWRDEIEIIIWPFSYFETRTRFHFVTLMFRDEIETSENHFSWSSEKNEADSRREFPGSRILADLWNRSLGRHYPI